MDPRAIEAVIAKRFGLASAPTLVARVTAAKLPVVFTHLRSADARTRGGANRWTFRANNRFRSRCH